MKISVKIGAFEQEYIPCWTTAPKAYDYGYVIEIYAPSLPEPGERDVRRVILIPEERFAYQTGRYASGMHATTLIEDDECPASYFEDKLVKRMIGREDA